MEQLVVTGGLILQKHITSYCKAVRFTDGNTVRMGVVNDVVLDHNVSIEHFVSGAPGVHHFIAHEDRLGPVSRRTPEDIATNDNIRGRAGGAACPELDHVPVIVATRGCDEVVKMVPLDQNI